MKIAVFSAQPYDREFLTERSTQSPHSHELFFFDTILQPQTASLAQGCDAICTFVNDNVDAQTIEHLPETIKLVCNRCAGFNNIDLDAASKRGITVARVPAYSPFATAEYTIALMMTLNRKIHKAHDRVRNGNFTINGLMGMDMYGKTVGVIGTGQIGAIVTRILSQGFRCRVLAYDVYRNEEVAQMSGVTYVDDVNEVYEQSDVITMHCPLNAQTHHLINEQALNQMKSNVLLINASRGAVIDTKAVIHALKRKRIGGLAIDVYENEGAFFFRDFSESGFDDDTLSRLTSFPNVIVTSHQAFFTREAMVNIASSVFESLDMFQEQGKVPEKNLVK